MPNTPRFSRRDFIRSSATAAAASVAAPAVVPLSTAAQVATRADPIEPMKIGVFGIDFTFWGIWADLLSPTGTYLGTSALRMRPTHIWDKDVGKAEAFARRWDCEVVDRYDGMLGQVDAVVNGGLHNVPWQHRLMRPYLEAGMPCFLQRHWSNTLRNLDGMLELADRHGAPIMATVPFEHYAEGDGIASRMNTVGEVQSVFGTSSVTDEPHFHLPYMALKILGYDVEWVSMTSDDVRRIGYLNINYGYPRTDSRRPFVASLHAARPDVLSLTVVGSERTLSASVPSTANFYTRFFDQLVDMQKAFERRTHHQPLDVIRSKYLCLQAAYYSLNERGGAPVNVGSVPADWPLPAWMPDWYDGSEFGPA